MAIFLGDYSIHGKRASVEEELAKHGSHNQASHGRKGGGRKGGGGGGGTAKPDTSNDPTWDKLQAGEVGPSDVMDFNMERADAASETAKELDSFDPNDETGFGREVAEAKAKMKIADEANMAAQNGESFGVDADNLTTAKINIGMAGAKLIGTKNDTLVAIGEKLVSDAKRMVDLNQALEFGD
jgi:hypothetical protein